MTISRHCGRTASYPTDSAQTCTEPALSRCAEFIETLLKGFTLFYGLLFCFPFSGNYNAST